MLMTGNPQLFVGDRVRILKYPNDPYYEGRIGRVAYVENYHKSRARESEGEDTYYIVQIIEPDSDITGDGITLPNDEYDNPGVMWELLHENEPIDYSTYQTSHDSPSKFHVGDIVRLRSDVRDTQLEAYLNTTSFNEIDDGEISHFMQLRPLCKIIRFVGSRAYLRYAEEEGGGFTSRAFEVRYDKLGKMFEKVVDA